MIAEEINFLRWNILQQRNLLWGKIIGIWERKGFYLFENELSRPEVSFKYCGKSDTEL